MADSTHILKLKATLDTSEVKSKLDQLRQVQQQALGNNQKSGNTPSQGVGGNLTQLTSTLNRLNTTMMQMQRTLSQLAVGNKIHQQTSSDSILPPMALTSQTQNKAADLINKFINKKAGQTILDFARKGTLDGLEDLYNSNRTDWMTTYFRTNLTPASSGMSFETWKNWMSKKDVQKQFELQFVNPPDSKRISNLQMLKPIAGLAFQQGTHILGDIYEQTGYKEAAYWTRSVGKVGGYAMMGSAAGPWGVVVGGALGAIESLFDYFTEKTKEAQKELEDWNKNIERSQTFKKTYDEAKETRTFNSTISKAVKTDDVETLQTMADQIQKNIDLNSKFLEGQRKGAEYGDTAENIMDIFNQQEKRISQLEHINSLIDQINEKQRKEAEIYHKNLDNQRKQVDILKQSYKWKEEENQNNTEITLGTYDYNMLGYKYNTYRTKYLDFKYQYKTYLDKAENAFTSEQVKHFLELASSMKEAMDFNKSQMDLFGGSQLDILNNLLSKIKAPDMTNVTSLASQGLMTYGKDEQLVDLQVDYMKQQLDVQKQIKDKIREHVEFE